MQAITSIATGQKRGLPNALGLDNKPGRFAVAVWEGCVQMTQAPTLQTEQLTLRASGLADFDAYAEFHASDRAKHLNILDRDDAWYAFATETAHWGFFGFGPWTVAQTLDDALVGFVGLVQHTCPQPELIWMVYDGFEGKSLAFEAVTAARDWVFENTDTDPVCSFIRSENARSINLAKRLGAVHTKKAQGNDKRILEFRHQRPEYLV